jgi:hypothetical protein
MRPSHERNDLWLYEGEHAVIDLGLQWAGEYLPIVLSYEVMVFVDMEPVAFGFIEADSSPNGAPLPTLGEAERHTPLERQFYVQTREARPFVFTVVIPPEAFGDLGAHDVRVVLVPDNGGRGYELGVPVLSGGPSFAFTVNYGGTDFVAEPPDTREDEVVYPPGDVPAYLSRPNIFLKPPIDATTLEATDISQLFRVPDERVSLQGWVENSGGFGEPNSRAVIALDGNRLLDTPRGQFELPEAPSGLDGYRRTKRDYAGEFDVEVSLTDNKIHRLRAFAFSDPYCRLRAPFDGGVSASNVVYVGQKAPD